MVGTLLVIIIIAGFALHQYIKGGLISGFMSFMAAIVGSTVAFGYYEAVASYTKDYSFIGPKAYPLAFFMLFLFVFVLIKEVAGNLLKPEISFGATVDRAGGIAFGIIVGYIVAGATLVAIGLLPFKANWLYGRFDDNLSNPPQANSILLNPDGFLSGLFGTISNGSFKGTNSFSLVHADYIDQIFLNRHLVGDGISPIAAEGAVSIVAPGVHAAPETLMEAPKEKGQPAQAVTQESGATLTLVKMQINVNELVPEESETQPKLGMAQLRLVLKDKQDAGDLSSGSGQAVYPVGYVNAAGQLQIKPLNAALDDEELKPGNLDFAFYVPSNTTPVLMEFRQNIVEEIRPMAPAAQPPAAPPAPTPEPNSTEPQP